MYGLGRMVCLWAYGFWAYGFGRMVLGVWFKFGLGRIAFGRMVLGAWFLACGFEHMVWLWAYGFGSMVLGAWFWEYGFGRIVWTYDFGGTALQTRAGQAQKVYSSTLLSQTDKILRIHPA